MKYLWLPLAFAVLPLSLTNCNKVKDATTSVASSGDFTFAKHTFEELTAGHVEVASDIDWDILKVPDANGGLQDVGAIYTQLPSDTEKKDFQKSFVLNFASGAGTVTYTDWKVSTHDGDRTEVTAQQPKGRLVLAVTKRDGKDRLSLIQLLR